MAKGKRDIEQTSASKERQSGGHRKLISVVSASDVIQIIIAIFTLFSVILTFCTIREMRIDRIAAYKPTVLINSVDYTISWNSNNEEEWLSSLPNNTNNSYIINEDGSITGGIHIPVSFFPDGLECFSAVNIGVGAAEDIVFEWNNNNLSALSTYLSVQNPAMDEFVTFGKSAVFTYGERMIITNSNSDVRLLYMLPNAIETYALPLPTAYSILIHEIIKYPLLDELPRIFLAAHYYDVQGKENTSDFIITINRTSYMQNQDGSGSATYQMTPTLLNN